MSIHSDIYFINNLKEYLHQDDINKIINNSQLPEQNTNLNRRTGRPIIGLPITRPRRLLKDGSIRNYKSVILKFAIFKSNYTGDNNVRIDENTIQKYNEVLLESNSLKYQTILTNIRILNRYIVTPLFGMEMKKPRASNAKPKNNKPRLRHKEILDTLRYLWKTCKNRDHIYKMILIFYTGLRYIETSAITYRDVLNARTPEHIILTVRKSKNYSQRNVCLFKGAPTVFFEDYLIPYLEAKMLILISNQSNVHEFLDCKIFSETSYQSTQKEFKSALKRITNDDKEILKGAGLHSIRSDYITRTLSLIYERCKNHHVAEKTVANLVGHKNKGLIYTNYISLGSLDDYEEFTTVPETTNEEERIIKDIACSYFDNIPKKQNLFKDLPSGSTVREALGNYRRNHCNLKNIINIVDSVYVIQNPKS